MKSCYDTPMNNDVLAYNKAQPGAFKEICEVLGQEIEKALPDAENKVWHGAPVWFINENPVAGYWVRKNNVQLLFWSGQSFEEEGLTPEGSFKAAEARYMSADEIVTADVQRWLEKAKTIQWNYKDIRKNKGKLERL